MAVRYDDIQKEIRLSVLDLVELGVQKGHLRLDLGATGRWRLAAGQAVHQTWQGERAADDGFQSEIRLKHSVGSGDWTVTVWGRVDGLTIEIDRTLVEEVKSTAFGMDRLYATTVEDWPAYVAQVEVYLWMLAAEKRPDPQGRLVMVSLADGGKHVIGVKPSLERVNAWIMDRIDHLRIERERRLAWLASRKTQVVPWPHAEYRPGQDEITSTVRRSLDRQERVLVEAPTGLGKTAAVMHAVLQYAMANGKQVFWATARNTQQVGVQKAVALFRSRGLSVRMSTLSAKEKACLNDIIACRPESCRFASAYWEKAETDDVFWNLAENGSGDLAGFRKAGTEAQMCPFQLGVDVGERVDVVIGDYNYVFDPNVALRRFFGDDAHNWIVVVDEAHQLVDRARGYGSPRLDAELARRAIANLQGDSDRPWREVAEDVLSRILEAGELASGPWMEGESPFAPSTRLWRDLADRVEELMLDYVLGALVKPTRTDDDPYLELARGVGRFADALERSEGETIGIAGVGEGKETLRLVCLDPSTWLRPRLERLGGLVLMSATLSPTEYYRDVLGLPHESVVVTVPSPFPPENRRILVVPRVSTAYKDREREAGPTAAILSKCIAKIPGNCAVFFSSFAMLRDITARMTLGDRELLAQEPQMTDARREVWLARLTEPGPKVVLAAVLGGIFAEGIDPPPGALLGVLVVGPALPPVGLERNLLREYCDTRWGEGFRYASLIPGMTRVIQAAGRLHRRPDDRGVIVLVDRRFRWRDYSGLFPADWSVSIPDDPALEIGKFWEKTE